MERNAWLTGITIFIVCAAAFVVLLNYTFLFRVAPAQDKATLYRSSNLNHQPSNTVKPVIPSALPSGNQKEPKSDISLLSKDESQVSAKTSKEEQQVKKRRTDLERARARVLKASEALTAAQARLEDALITGMIPLKAGRTAK